MKNLIIIVLLFSFNAYADENKFTGFGKIKWGASIKKYKNVMRLTSDNGKPSKYYVRKDDEMSFGDIGLTSITYIFYKGKFSSAIIQTDKTITKTSQILNKLKKKFGEPSYKNVFTNKYRWKDSTTAVSLKCYSTSHKCSIIYNSVVMSELKKADNEAAAKKARHGY